MTNIDADLRQADWLRESFWDLPTDPDEFRGVLRRNQWTVEHFMSLPAARAMPDEIRRSLGVLVESKARHVRTPAGSLQFGLPIGAPIPEGAGSQPSRPHSRTRTPASAAIVSPKELMATRTAARAKIAVVPKPSSARGRS